MKNTVIINIYNFIRMSHVEPSVFIPDDFETAKKQIILTRQYGFPATYALKYDALMNPRYQELLKNYTGEGDEISAWWEITEELCQKAGVSFRGFWTEEYDDRVNSAYSIGYTPEERRRLVDAYMKDFRNVFGFYPKTIGSWVLDTVTISYAAEKYGILGSAICRDQIGTDGFTLWGGFPNGIYYPGCNNENVPADSPDSQLSVPMFRLLGPDPIYNFEQDVRNGLQGVYTLEPSWLTGRNPEWISWFFERLTKEPSLGICYAHVGQENNFLWENIQPGLEPQLKKLRRLTEENSHADGSNIHVETMADSAARFRHMYKMTPPTTFQASADWDKSRNLSAQWYACSNYRLGFLGEGGHLRIRDFFLYRHAYPSRYLKAPMRGAVSVFDALPLLFPQLWQKNAGQRPFIRLLDQNGQEPSGSVRFLALDKLTARAELCEQGTETVLAAFTLYPDHILLEGNYRLCFDFLPVFRSWADNRIQLEYEGFSYHFEVTEGTICRAGQDGLEISPVSVRHPEIHGKDSIAEPGRILLTLGRAIASEDIFTDKKEEYQGGVSPDPFKKCKNTIPVPPMAPVADPASCIFPADSVARIALAAPGGGEIRYTLDKTEPTPDSPLYVRPLTLRKDTVISAKIFLPDGNCSETTVADYRFGLQGIRLTSDTLFDPRPVFAGKGIEDLLNPLRGSLDYLDGRWRGTLQDLDIWGELPAAVPVEAITIGFLSHHRSGIVFPESLRLYTGMDRESLALTARLELPCEPCAREIARQDFSLPVGQTIKAFRLVAHRYERMPQWCCYRGAENVFTMADNIIVTPFSSPGSDNTDK